MAPTTGVLDDFNRADGSPGANWGNPLFSGAELMEIVSNTLTRNATYGYANAYWSVATFGGSGLTDEVWGTLSTIPASDREVSLFLGMVNPATAGIDGYSLVIQNGIWQVRRIDNEAETNLGADISQALSANDSVGLSRASGVLEVWYRASGGS